MATKLFKEIFEGAQMNQIYKVLFIFLFAGVAQAQSMGALVVNGEAGKFQIFAKVKAVRCDAQVRGQCDAPVYFGLRQETALPAGTYIVGFENSIYPDLVKVDAGSTRVLNLEKITVPSKVTGEVVRVYRDFSNMIEQKKLYLSMYYMNRHFFRLEKDNFGDLYLTGSWERDFVQRFNYELCAKISSYSEASNAAKNVCAGWSGAKAPLDLRDLFSFNSDGTFQEMWVTYPADVIPTKHPRYIVSAPFSASDFVSVFPGAYKVQADGKGQRAVAVKVGNLTSSERTLRYSLNTDLSFTSLGEVSPCLDAQTWKTDQRSYCTNDNQEGCNRTQAETCEAMSQY